MISILTEDEKKTLAMLLREKIFETHNVEEAIKMEIKNASRESTREILKKAKQHISNTRKDCYNIARKLGIK